MVIDGVIEPIYFLITSIGFIILSFIQYKKNRKNLRNDLSIYFSNFFYSLLYYFKFLLMKGTKFQLKVWKYLKTIPKGTVKTYKQVAIAIKRPKSARAVANACGKNPYAPKIPCHRVIRSDGGLGGYSGRGGIKTKLRLLRSEKVDI